MARVEAHELVAHGLACDYHGCDTLLVVRNAESKPEGYYIDAERVTENGVHRVNPEQLFFCSKDCMLEALKWQFSALVHQRVGPLPRSVVGQQYTLVPRQVRPVDRHTR